MTTHIWAIDTPWAKKGTAYRGYTVIMHNLISRIYGQTFTLNEKKLLDLGWIKPVEDKKLTEEEILEAITHTTIVPNNTAPLVTRTISSLKIAKFLAEHLK